MGNTIEDFGKQWTRFRENTGFYVSEELFDDVVGPYFDKNDLKGKTVIDVGSGTGRMVQILAVLGCKKIVAVEPSECFRVLVKNTEKYKDIIEYQNAAGGDFDFKDADYATSKGVIHHIKHPDSTVRNVHESLKPGGKFIMWIYAKEGSEAYLRVINVMRPITTRTPDFLLSWLSHVLNALMLFYIFLCKFIKLPMRDYVLNVFKKLDYRSRHFTIFDQLNPTDAMYYTRQDTEDLLRRNGFNKFELYNRHGYSWTAIATKE
jgi:SAM-dependent methyltransferase